MAWSRGAARHAAAVSWDKGLRAWLRSRKQKAASTRPSLVAEANRAGWVMNPRTRAFLRAVEQRLQRRDGGTVAILARSSSSDLAALIADAFPAVHVLPLVASRSTSVLHAALAADGPVDLLIDETGRLDLFRNLFFHVKPSGAIVVQDWAAGRIPTAGEESVWSFVARVIEERAAGGVPETDDERDDAALGQAIGSLALTGRHLVVVNRVDALAKLREDEVDSLLQMPGGSPRGVVVEQVPAVEFPSRCGLTEHNASRESELPRGYSAPALSLRKYQDVVCAPGQVLLQDNVVLPDSYRHNQYPRLTNRFTTDLSPYFAQVAEGWSEATQLSGAYFHLDSEWPGHFGHVMTEQLSRLWAWASAKRAQPDLKALLSVPPRRTELRSFQLELFEAAGIAAEDLVLIDEPMRVETMWAATPMFSMPSYVHPEILTIWESVGQELASSAHRQGDPQRIFCSRKPTYQRRRCHNAAEVEAFFAGHGFEVLYPEDLPMARQASIFRGAQIVAGFAGSGLFNLALGGPSKRVIVIGPESYRASNEYMMASVLGHTLDLVWCRPDVPQPAGGVSELATRSAFSVDFNAEGRDLARILKSL